MGDSSATLGFVFRDARDYRRVLQTLPYLVDVVLLLLFTFIYDTAFTFVRRWLCGENVTEAHRSHLYQLLNRLGQPPHASTTRRRSHPVAWRCGCRGSGLNEGRGVRAGSPRPCGLHRVGDPQAHRHGLLNGSGSQESSPAA
jgi:hypothetical protein